ncbi:CRISPR-associated endonuclease Cas2 [Acidaminococcus fermentans]|uniref:CRISPR-associated endonuclease Cas2 n=1 Tax=Acidaminococcus fermentans TaxID=905 RepID=UPI0024319BAC|nr:CRISPR-associated endonuclease Cas2 [Acidaminococcus fermentans]
MSYRYMRIFVMFDLPVGTTDERRTASKYRKYLVKSGFMMLQESVYCKLAPNDTVAASVVNSLKKNCPESGSVIVLRITEKQFQNMDFLVGNMKQDVLHSDERIVIL